MTERHTDYTLYANMESLHERLKACRIKLGYNQQRMAKDTGMAQKDISLIESGKRIHIPVAYFQALSAQGIDMNWVYTGKGEMFLKDTLEKYKEESETNMARTVSFHGSRRVELVTVDKEGRSAISMVPIRASAGYTALCHDREFIEDLAVFSLPDFQAGNFRAFEIMGDSMELTVLSQDWVVGERVNAASQLKDGAIYVIVTSGNIVCKRIRNQIERRGVIVLQSDNAEYEDQTLEPESIIEMWLVRARLTKDFRSTQAAVRFYGEEIRRLEKMNESLVAMRGS